MVNIDQIQLSVTTGGEGLNRGHRVFLGFTGRHGREFRCRELDGSGNPFTSNSTITLKFGDSSNVENPNLNDPRKPAMDTLQVGRAYIRIDPDSEHEWLIQDARVLINGTLAHQLRIPGIILDEDGSEIVYLD